MEQTQLPDYPTEHQTKPHYKLAPLEGKARVRFVDDVESIELERSQSSPAFLSNLSVFTSLLNSPFVDKPQKYLEATSISRTPLTKTESVPNIVWKPGTSPKCTHISHSLRNSRNTQRNIHSCINNRYNCKVSY